MSGTDNTHDVRFISSRGMLKMNMAMLVCVCVCMCVRAGVCCWGVCEWCMLRVSVCVWDCVMVGVVVWEVCLHVCVCVCIGYLPAYRISVLSSGAVHWGRGLHLNTGAVGKVLIYIGTHDTTQAVS